MIKISKGILLEYALALPPLALVFDFNPETMSRSRTITLRTGTAPGTRGGPWWLKVGAQVRYVDPRAYADSQLEADQRRREADGSPYLYGTAPILLPIASAGIAYDTRDDALWTTASS